LGTDHFLISFLFCPFLPARPALKGAKEKVSVEMFFCFAPAWPAGPKGSQKWLVLNNFFVLPPTLKGAKKGLRSKYFFDLPFGD